MTLLELNNKIMSPPTEDNTKQYYLVTEEDMSTFAEILSIDPAIYNLFQECDNCEDFFKTYTSVLQVFEKKKAVEIFYAFKMGFDYSGISNKFAYALRKALESTDGKYINLALHKCSGMISQLVYHAYTDETITTAKDIIDNVYKKKSTLLSNNNLTVKNDDCYEVYIPSHDCIALIPDDIAASLSFDDCEELRLDPKVGLVLHDVPLRTLGGRLGITMHELDLRNCI